jgi:hypothetical protein
MEVEHAHDRGLVRNGRGPRPDRNTGTTGVATQRPTVAAVASDDAGDVVVVGRLE